MGSIPTSPTIRNPHFCGVFLWFCAGIEPGSPLFLFSHPSYILWLYYTTDGVALSLISAALRAQECRVEIHGLTIGSRADFRLPVEAIVAHIIQIAAIPSEAASAEEGEGSYQSISFCPVCLKKSFVFENGLLPKNPE